MIVLKLAIRNLFRNTRRTLLTAILITLGVALVIAAGSLTEGFRTSVIDVLTNTQLAHFQVHKSGYMDSIDTMPMNLYLTDDELIELESVLNGEGEVKVSSPRIKFSSIISTGSGISNIRLTAVYPEKESGVCPGILDQMEGPTDKSEFLKPGEIIVPDAIVRGFSLKTGDEIRLKSTNRHGVSQTVDLKVAGIMTTFESPQGRSGYIHMDDAKALLGMDALEISEVAVRTKSAFDGAALQKVIGRVASGLPDSFEIHGWEKLSPFASILALVNIVNLMVQFILIAIVLISVLNIMMMSVYERVHEIGTIAAIGTVPGKILRLFLGEGIMLGLLSILAGSLLGSAVVLILGGLNISFKAGPFTMAVSGNISLQNMLLTAVLVLVISLVASFLPSFKAAKLEPVDALNHV